MPWVSQLFLKIGLLVASLSFKMKCTIYLMLSFFQIFVAIYKSNIFRILYAHMGLYLYITV